MKKQVAYKLIYGDFTAEESREILVNVFSSKIQFHQMKNFSSQERFGKADKISTNRIPALNKSLEKILKTIAAAEKKGQRVEIISEVSLRVINPENNV